MLLPCSKYQCMYYRKVLLSILLVIPSLSYAQNDFSSGSILLINGDTLNVMIKNESGRIAPRFLEYRASISSETKMLSVSQVKWFRYKDGEWYFPYSGPIENSSLNNYNLTYDSLMHII